MARDDAGRITVSHVLGKWRRFESEKERSLASQGFVARRLERYAAVLREGGLEVMIEDECVKVG